MAVGAYVLASRMRASAGNLVMMALTIGTICFCTVSGGSFARAQEPTRLAETVKRDAKTASSSDAFDAYIQSRMQRRHIPGVSVAIVRDGKVVRAKGYGLANVELSVPATENTVYQLASVTKTFTATAVMMLVEDGKLGLDDKITARLPDLPAAWGEVTVRHLLCHTSGIKSYTSVKDFHKTARKDYSRREILDLVAKEPLEFAPGEKWNYSNTGVLPARDAHRESDRQDVRLNSWTSASSSRSG